MDIKKRKCSGNVDASFLLSPTISCIDYKPMPPDPHNSRAIPFPDGPFGDNPYVTVDDNGSSVTFMMQKGPEKGSATVENIIQFAKAFIEQSNQGATASRQGSVIITKLDEALQWCLYKKLDEQNKKADVKS